MAAEKTDDLIISISTDLATVRRSLKRLESDIASTSGNVVKQFDKMGRGIDSSMTTALQARIDKMVGIGEKGAKEWTGALADQGKELERLRARYSPLFSTLNTYKQTVADIRRAHAVGAISATEMTAAITRERQAALASTAAIKGRNKALQETPAARRGGDSFNTANLAAQFQDIGVTAAMGMSPLQIALQQGTQISAVLGPMGAAGAVKSLGAAFLSVINPVSLATIGLVAASAAAIQYFTSTDTETSKAEEALKNHADLIRRIKDAWPEAAEGLKEYSAESKKIVQQDTRDAINLYRGLIAETASDSRGSLLNIPAGDFGGATRTISEVQSAIASLDKSVAAGNPNLRGFIERLIEIENQSGTPENIKALIKEIRESANAGLDAQSKLEPLVGVISGVGQAAAREAARVDAFAKSLTDLRGIAVPALTDMQQVEKTYLQGLQKAKSREERDDLYAAREDARRRIDNQNPTVINPDGRRVGVPSPGEKPIQLGDEPNKKAETAVSRAKQAYDDLIKSANDRIAQLRLETELTGQYGTATDAARFRLDLLQQAEDKGRSLSPEQRAQIEEKVEAYRKYAEALSEAKLQQDLLDKARMAGLSKREQEVTRTLREYGLPEDLGSKNAGLIRDQLQRDEVTSAADAFIDDFTGALLSGGDDIGKRLGQVILSALMDSAQQQLSTLLKQVFGALMNGGKGGAVGPVASVASTFAAPVGAVSRGALAPAGDIGAYAKAIQAIESGGNYGALGPVTRTGDRAYGAYQVMGSNIGPWSQAALGRSMTASEFLADRGAQDAIFNHRFGGYVDRFGPSGAAQAWFGGPGSVGKGGMGADILGTTGNAYVAKFNANIAKMGDVAGQSVKGLNGLNGGLQAITQNFGAGAGLGGGGFNWASLFSPSFTPNTNIGNFLKGIPGFAKGTDNAPRGLAIVGEDGPELVHFRGGERVIPNKRIAAPRAPTLRARSAANSNGPGSTTLQVNINGASGDPHVRELVRQGVQEALAGQQEQMRRGGFGDMQDRYVSQRR